MGFFQGNPGMSPLRDTHVSGTYGALEAAQALDFRAPPAGRTAAACTPLLGRRRPQLGLPRGAVLSFAVPLIVARGVM